MSVALERETNGLGLDFTWFFHNICKWLLKVSAGTFFSKMVLPFSIKKCLDTVIGGLQIFFLAVADSEQRDSDITVS